MKAQEVYDKLRAEGTLPDSFEACIIANDYAKKNPDSENSKRFVDYINSTNFKKRSNTYGAALLVIAEKIGWIEK